MKKPTHHDRKKLGYKNDHHLIEEKIIPEEFVALQRELAKPEHADIFNVAIKGKDFAECIGTIAAAVGVVLDATYTPEDLVKLAELLTNRLRNRKIGVLLVNETDLTIPVNIREAGEYLVLEEKLDPFTRMMREANCQQCDNRAACMKAGHCLGDDSTSELEGLTKEQMERFGL